MHYLTLLNDEEFCSSLIVLNSKSFVVPHSEFILHNCPVVYSGFDAEESEESILTPYKICLASFWGNCIMMLIVSIVTDEVVEKTFNSFTIE